MADWLDDLEEFGAAVVAGACDEWRRTQTRRPTPADIWKLCDQKRGKREVPPAVYRPSSADDQRALVGIDERNRRFAEASAWQQRFAKERGFRDFGEVMKYGIVAAFKIEPGTVASSPSREQDDLC